MLDSGRNKNEEKKEEKLDGDAQKAKRRVMREKRAQTSRIDHFLSSLLDRGTHTHTHTQKGIMMVVSLRGVLISTAKRSGSSSCNDGLGQQMEETMKDISF